MKKRTLLAGAIGIAGGLGYLLWKGKPSDRPNQTTGNGKGNGVDLSSRSGQAAEDARIDKRAASMNRFAVETETDGPEVLDERGTDQAGAAEILRNVRDEAFEGSDEKLALALGRPIEEIEGWTNGAGAIDGDVLLKARGLANLRGIHLE